MRVVGAVLRSILDSPLRMRVGLRAEPLTRGHRGPPGAAALSRIRGVLSQQGEPVSEFLSRRPFDLSKLSRRRVAPILDVGRGLTLTCPLTVIRWAGRFAVEGAARAWLLARCLT
jgi:hypothetical protein